LVQEIAKDTETIESGAYSALGCAPLAVLLTGTFALRTLLPPWAFMWTVAFSIYAGLKWLTWWKARTHTSHQEWRSIAYLALWPGMDADSFLDANKGVPSPPMLDWFLALFKTFVGAILLWVVSQSIPEQEPLLRGWVGMLGLLLVLHFGIFQVLALVWQSLGVEAVPIMSAPLRSTSLSEFWGKRWNLGFRQLSYDLIFRPLNRKFGTGGAGFLVFVASGLIHDLVISIPARGGYGLPTLYFMLQGLGVAVERSDTGKRLGLRRGLRGWLLMAAFTAGPVFWLFHPPFVRHVMLPFMKVIHAL
jgi:hypothetical protein